MRKFVLTLVIVAIVVAGLALGIGLGRKQGKIEGSREAEEKLAPLVDIAFPKAPAELMSLTGTVKAVLGGTIDLEVRDPDDNLPHADGSPQSVEIRYANVTSATKYTLIDYSTPDRTGNPARKTMRLADLKTGDLITVKSSTNIRNAQRFDVTEVELVKY